MRIEAVDFYYLSMPEIPGYWRWEPGCLVGAGTSGGVCGLGRVRGVSSSPSRPWYARCRTVPASPCATPSWGRLSMAQRTSHASGTWCVRIAWIIAGRPHALGNRCGHVGPIGQEVGRAHVSLIWATSAHIPRRLMPPCSLAIQPRRLGTKRGGSARRDIARPSSDGARRARAQSKRITTRSWRRARAWARTVSCLSMRGTVLG